MKKNGYTIVEMLVVIGVLGIFTVAILSSTSYAYKDKSEDYYNDLVESIERQASLYGETIANLKDEGNLVIVLSDMIDAGYYEGDSEGNVVDPRNSKANLNGLKIKLTYNENGNISAEVINDD